MKVDYPKYVNVPTDERHGQMLDALSVHHRRNKPQTYLKALELYHGLTFAQTKKEPKKLEAAHEGKI